jgi:hypothetical protein
MDWTDLGPKLRAVAEREGWTFHPPLDEDRLAAFERAHGVSLPEPYRRFLCEVTGGIDTDCMQLSPFERSIEEREHPLSESFPYRTAYGDQILSALAGGQPLAALARDPVFAALQVHGLPRGCLVVGELDGIQSVLVLSGEERGRIWQVGDFDLPETRHRHTGDGNLDRLDFAAWFDCWLHENGLRLT